VGKCLLTLLYGSLVETRMEIYPLLQEVSLVCCGCYVWSGDSAATGAGVAKGQNSDFFAAVGKDEPLS
jgi:hypothetical protein